MQAKSKKFVVFFEYALTLHMVPKHQLDDQQTGVEGAEECEPVFEHRQSRGGSTEPRTLQLAQHNPAQ